MAVTWRLLEPAWAIRSGSYGGKKHEPRRERAEIREVFCGHAFFQRSPVGLPQRQRGRSSGPLPTLDSRDRQIFRARGASNRIHAHNLIAVCRFVCNYIRKDKWFLADLRLMRDLADLVVVSPHLVTS